METPVSVKTGRMEGAGDLSGHEQSLAAALDGGGLFLAPDSDSEAVSVTGATAKIARFR